jgi:hypothetical protein
MCAIYVGISYIEGIFEYHGKDIQFEVQNLTLVTLGGELASTENGSVFFK